jgi:hypothetical protein
MVTFDESCVMFLTGWQTRWFILDNGVLAYYKSQEEVNQGCKGSMKVTACEIIGNYNHKRSYLIYAPKVLNVTADIECCVVVVTICF